MDVEVFRVIGYSLVLLIIGFACFSVFIRKDVERYSVRLLFVYVFSLKVVISIFLLRYIISIHGDPYLTPDTENYADMGATLSRFGTWSYEGYIPVGWDKIPHIYSLVFNLVGSEFIFTIITWNFVSCLISIPVYHIAKKIYDRKSAYVSSVVVLIYPSFLALSIAPLKGTFVALSLCLIALSLLNGNVSPQNMSMLFAGSCVLALVRPEMLFVILIATVCWASFYLFHSGGVSFFWRSSLFIALFIFVAIYIHNTRHLIDYIKVESLLSRIELTQGKFDSDTGVHNYVINQGIFIRSILGSAFFMIKPFPPWETLSTLGLSALLTPGAISLYIMAPCIASGFWSVRSNTNAVLLFSIILTTILVSSAFMGAVTARYRVQIMPFVLVFFSGGFVNGTTDKWHLFVYYTIFFVFLFLYVSIKAVA
jgi:hypothetical protein